jgi:hypothetical protein
LKKNRLNKKAKKDTTKIISFKNNNRKEKQVKFAKKKKETEITCIEYDSIMQSHKNRK